MTRTEHVLAVLRQEIEAHRQELDRDGGIREVTITLSFATHGPAAGTLLKVGTTIARQRGVAPAGRREREAEHA